MDCQTGPRIQGFSVSTVARTSRSKPTSEAHRWWARAAYNGQDRAAALAALDSSGIPLKSVAGTKDLLSAMARGDALIKGAARLAVPRRKGSAKNARYHRLLQWRLVMGYAGFEIFAKACLGKSEKGGLEQEDFERLVAACRLPKLAIPQPFLNAQTSPPNPLARIAPRSSEPLHRYIIRFSRQEGRLARISRILSDRAWP